MTDRDELAMARGLAEQWVDGCDLVRSLCFKDQAPAMDLLEAAFIAGWTAREAREETNG